MKAFEMIVVVNNLLWEICCCFSSACVENLSLSQSITNKCPKWMEWPNWGQLVHYKHMWPGTKKETHLLVHCSDCFVFLITPPVHEDNLMVKNCLNSELLRPNPEMTPLVCFSYSFPGWWHCQESDRHPSVLAHAFMYVCIFAF